MISDNLPLPCYVLDVDRLRQNLALVDTVRKEAGVSVMFALKSFAMWSVFPLLDPFIDGASVSSLNEARLASEHLNQPLHLFMPAIKASEVRLLADLVHTINYNSFQQINELNPLFKRYNKDLSVGLRINPGYSEVKTALYNPAAPDSRLGVGKEALPLYLPDEVEGLHFHTLCESREQSVERTLKHLHDDFNPWLQQVKWLNMGGGHLFTANEFDLQNYIALLKDFKREHNLALMIEPGAAFVWEAGILVASVVDIVENGGVKTAILDVSFTAHMPDTLEMPYKPDIRGAGEPSGRGYVYRMGGNSCLAGDYMGDYEFDHPLQKGENIIFEDMAHYTMVKTTMFNGVQHPAIAKWSSQDGFELIREFGYEDYKKRLS